MKRILLLLSVLLSTLTFAQGHETFDNLELEGNSYTSGSFEGQNGITWTFGEARADIELNGKAITLGRNRPNPMFLESATIANGVGTLEFSYMQAFSKNVGLEVFVNDQLVYTAISEDEAEVIKHSGPITVDISGDIVLRFENPAEVGQITIDDIIWTEFDDTAGIDSKNQIGFQHYPNPMRNSLNINAKISIDSVEGFNILGQKVMNLNNFQGGRIDVSALSAGTYIFRVKFENGSQESFKVLKQ